MFPRRILYAADGSTASDRARERVVDLVRGRSSVPDLPPCEVHLVYVEAVSAWTYSATLNPGQRQRLREEGQVVLDEQIARITAAGVAPAASHLALGRAVDEILRLRDQIEADLIVMGSRGLNAFSRVLLGSDAEGVVRHAPCSVLVVREDA